MISALVGTIGALGILFSIVVKITAIREAKKKASQIDIGGNL